MHTGFIILFSLGISLTSVAREFILHFLLFLSGTDGKTAVLIGCNASALTESTRSRYDNCFSRWEVFLFKE